MNRRGFALLAVLWLLTALTMFAGGALAVSRLGVLTTRNRVLLARAGWAREACVAIVQARYAADSAVRLVDTVNLGRGTWCRAVVEDPGARAGTGPININAAPAQVLGTVPGLGPEAVRVILERRGTGHQILSVDELGGLLSPPARRALMDRYPEFLTAVSYAPTQLVIDASGGVRGTALVVGVRATTVPVGRRLALVRRESE